MPAGMRLLPDEEREALLCSLIRSKRDAESTLQALPFNVETHSQVSIMHSIHFGGMLHPPPQPECWRLDNE